MTTDTADLLSPKLAWRIRENRFNALFRPRPQIVVVVDGETPEQSEAAASLLAARLRAEPALFHSVRRPDAGPFWSHNGLLYAATGSVRATMAELLKAEPLLGPMAADPSLRGLMAALSTFLKGVSSNAASLEDLHKPIQALATALGAAAHGSTRFLFLACADPRRQTGSARVATHHSDRAAASVRSAGSRQTSDRGHPRGREESQARPRARGTRAPDRDGSPAGRGTEHTRPTGTPHCRSRARRHHRDAVDGGPLGAADRGDPGHHASRADRSRDGGPAGIHALQRDLGGRDSTVRRSRHRLRHSSQCPLSGREDARHRGASRPGRNRAGHGSVAVPGGDRHRRGFLRLHAYRLLRSVPARNGRRARHVHRADPELDAAARSDTAHATARRE